MTYNWRIGGVRGANMIIANPQRLTSKDGTRWACGRNVKGEMKGRPGCYEGVEVWTLKHRVAGKAVTLHSGQSRERAEQWVENVTPVQPSLA